MKRLVWLIVLAFSFCWTNAQDSISGATTASGIIKNGQEYNEYEDDEKIDENKIYSSSRVQQAASYPNMIEFLKKNIQYPEDALMNSLQGVVFVNFVVNADGSVSDVKIARSAGSSLDKEALRIISLMKYWNPATINGKAVRSYFTLPIRFSLK